LVPKAVRIAVLVNPANTPVTETTLRDIPEAARVLGLQIDIVKASTGREIEEACAAFAREQADALFVASDIFFLSRRIQLATLAVHYRIPATITLARLSKSAGS
jgi:putative ABC transport system substrate-binding protein